MILRLTDVEAKVETLRVYIAASYLLNHLPYIAPPKDVLQIRWIVQFRTKFNKARVRTRRRILGVRLVFCSGSSGCQRNWSMGKISHNLSPIPNNTESSIVQNWASRTQFWVAFPSYEEPTCSTATIASLGLFAFGRYILLQPGGSKELNPEQEIGGLRKA